MTSFEKVVQVMDNTGRGVLFSRQKRRMRSAFLFDNRTFCDPACIMPITQGKKTSLTHNIFNNNIKRICICALLTAYIHYSGTALPQQLLLVVNCNTQHSELSALILHCDETLVVNAIEN